jgi:signal transduction histidine kinase/CheY-like chemotaxis protein
MSEPSDKEKFLGLLLDHITTSRLFSHDSDVEVMLEEMARLLHVSGAFVTLISPGTRNTVDARYSWFDFDMEPVTLEDERLTKIIERIGEGPIVVNDTFDLPEDSTERQDLENAGRRAVLFQMAYLDGSPRGIVGFVDRQPRIWSPTDLELTSQLTKFVVSSLNSQIREQEIRTSRERTNLAVEAGGMGFFEWYVEASHGNFEFPSSLDDVMSRGEVSNFDDLTTMLSVDNVERLVEAWRVYNENNLERFTAELRFPDDDGLERFMLIQGKLVALPEDFQQHKIVGVVQDISLFRREETTRTQLEEQLMLTQKRESLGMMAGGIAHDFNNLLTSIVGNAELVQRTLPADTSSHQFVDEIIKATGVAADLCGQMLSYAGQGVFSSDIIDIAFLVKDIQGLLESSVSRRIKVVLAIEETEPVYADASQIQQILLNLVINAGESIGEQAGTITLTTGTLDCHQAYLAEPHIEYALLPGRYTFLQVSDSGSGMTEEVAARLFDPFYTTKFTGRGLGMSTVLGIVRGHQGTIKVASAVDQGTTVRVLLPAQQAQVKPTVDTSRSETTGAMQNVMFVDDDEFILRTGTAILNKLKYTPICFNSGTEAIRAFKDNHNEIDVIILDLTMPGMDGLATFRELKKIQPDVKVILTSGYSEQEATRHFEDSGLAAFIKKPYLMSQLQQTLRSVLSGSAPEN